jgi:hypothetical protein
MRVTKSGKVRRSAAEWRAIGERFVQSRLRPKEFCQREAIALGTFKKWYPRCMASGAQPAAFVELVSPAVVREPWAVELELPSGARLRLRG